MSDALSNFHFIRPAWLLLLPLAFVVWWWWQHRSDPLRGWREQIDPGLLEALVVGREGLGRLPALVLLAFWVLAILAVAGPTWKLEPSPFADDASPVIILLKADASMETPDPAPSRIERARLKIADFARARPGQPLGLIAYAGSAHLVLPPTRDTGIVARMAAEISPEIMPQPGDRLDLALARAEEVLKKDGDRGTIIVMADSVGTDADDLSRFDSLAVHFLALQGQDSPPDPSLRTAAKALGGSIRELSAEEDDIDALVHLAARAPTAQAGEQGAKWQESGYWISPLIALLFVTTLRRESVSKEVPA